MCMSATQGAGLGLSALGSLTGNPLAIASLVTQLAGTGVQAYNQNQMLKKQDAIAAEGIVKQGALQKQGEGDVQSTINTMNQSTANTQAKSAQQLDAYRKALQQSSGISNSASPDVPGASKAYKATQNSANASANDYVNAIAGSAATTQGTQLERVGEGQAMADTATKLGTLTGQSNEQNYVTQIKMRQAQQNPWLSALGETLKGASMITGFMAGQAPSGAAGTATNVGGDLNSAVAAPVSSMADMTAGAGSFGAPVAGGATAFGGAGMVPNALQYASAYKPTEI